MRAYAEERERTDRRDERDDEEDAEDPAVPLVVLVSDGLKVTYSLDGDRSHAGDTFRPTVLMERVRQRLEMQTERKSQRWIEENVIGKGAGIRAAIERLVDEGYVDHETGRGYLSVVAYREVDDEEVRPDRVPDDEAASAVRPGRVPDLRSTPHREADSDRVPGASPVRPEGRSAPGCVPASPLLGRRWSVDVTGAERIERRRCDRTIAPIA